MGGAKSKLWATTSEVCEAAGVSDTTVFIWARRGVLPPYKRIFGGRHGNSARWPLLAPEQARWVRGKLEEGFTFDEISALLAQGEFRSEETRAPED